ncbi:phage capsid protein [Brucella sp. IR073]|uniref:phage capsid protein n=1 Tax=unclassified Brucella TaxID=2632610 RepID=UPI003B984D52
MAETAFQVQYRQEFIAGFERKQSFLRPTTVTEAVFKGNEAVFLVADTNNAQPVTRGVNGLIPSRADDLNQHTATLVEWHDKPRRTNFNIFASQGDGRRIMQEGTRKVMNRKIDDDIISALNTATVNTGAATTASLSLVMKAMTILDNNNVQTEDEDNMWFVATGAFRAYLMQIPEFANALYVDVKPFNGPSIRVRRWAGFNWIFHQGLPGKGTANEVCFAYHRDAIGHAVNTGEMMVAAGYNEEDDYYWARTSIFMGSKLLQNPGVVKINHDGSAFAAS